MNKLKGQSWVRFTRNIEWKLTEILEYIIESQYDHFGFDNKENQHFIRSIAAQGVKKKMISPSQLYWVERYWDIVENEYHPSKIVFENVGNL